MELKLTVRDPARFDVLSPPVPLLSRAGGITLMFEVINRSAGPLKSMHVFLTAKDELRDIVAMDQAKVPFLDAGETRPIRLTLPAEAARCVSLTLQLAALPASASPQLAQQNGLL